MGRAQASGIAGSESACASKSLSSRPWERPVRRAVSGPSIVQGALVSLSVRPSTGPAPQAIAERGFCGELRLRRFDRLGQARIVVGMKIDDRPQSRPRRARLAQIAHWCRRCRRPEPGTGTRCRSWPAINAGQSGRGQAGTPFQSFAGPRSSSRRLRAPVTQSMEQNMNIAGEGRDRPSRRKIWPNWPSTGEVRA